MVVQHNITAMNANRYFGINNKKLSKSLEKLSSGYAINRAGDNAAGLAVSEKMRSQIAGMTQAVKNAQDGISMVQTYEGALTETDSILQRMKTLATQIANGGYDDPVDRTAAQQEFYQLNDELNQIADTDYNGVVVLNGGVMADGLKAVDGMFDYSNKAAQVAEEQAAALAAAQADAQKKIDSAQRAFDSAFAAYNAVTKRDLSNNGDAVQWNTVDDSMYTQKAADKLFGKLTNGTDSLTDAGISSVDVTFKYNEADKNWTIESATYVNDDGEEKEVKYTQGFATNFANANKGSGSGLGGFEVTDADGNVIANAIFDSTKLNDGDTVTLTFTNNANASYAPKNVGFDDNSFKKDATLNVDAPTIRLSNKVTDGDMSEELAAALEKLNNAHVGFEYKNGKLEGSIDQGLYIERDTVNSTIDKEVWLIKTAEDNNGVTLAEVTLDPSRAASTGKAVTKTIMGKTEDTHNGTGWGNTINSSETLELIYNGNSWETADGTDAADALKNTTEFADITDVKDLYTGTAVKGDKIKLSLNLGSVIADAGVTDTDANGTLSNGDTRKAVIKVDYTPMEATNGKMSFDVAVDAWDYNAYNKGPDVSAGKNNKITEDTTAIDKRYLEAKKLLAEVKAAYPGSFADLPDEYKVSQSDAFNNSEAKMTYKDHIILQVGARTKDAVDFTFQYDSDSIGDLKADLNCTAKGLGTDILDIKTQESANYAIDKIDQAINKVSLVRGTFGAIQNRLDHKIDNLNVTVENLTDAESRIRDTNMAEEMMNFTKNQILSQASQSMLAQANQLPQSVLQLLQ